MVGRALTGVAGSEAMVVWVDSSIRSCLSLLGPYFEEYCLKPRRIRIAQIANVRRLMCHLRIYGLCEVNSQEYV